MLEKAITFMSRDSTEEQESLHKSFQGAIDHLWTLGATLHYSFVKEFQHQVFNCQASFPHFEV